MNFGGDKHSDYNSASKLEFLSKESKYSRFFCLLFFLLLLFLEIRIVLTFNGSESSPFSSLALTWVFVSPSPHCRHWCLHRRTDGQGWMVSAAAGNIPELNPKQGGAGINSYREKIVAS